MKCADDIAFTHPIDTVLYMFVHIESYTHIHIYRVYMYTRSMYIYIYNIHTFTYVCIHLIYTFVIIHILIYAYTYQYFTVTRFSTVTPAAFFRFTKRTPFWLHRWPEATHRKPSGLCSAVAKFRSFLVTRSQGRCLQGGSCPGKRSILNGVDM